MSRLELKQVRHDVSAYCESLLDRDRPYGCYRAGRGKLPDLYASCDIAIVRAIMGEDLSLLPDRQRREWIDHINSFVDRERGDGSYTDRHGHSPLHANGMVIGALGPLGGKQAMPCRLYEPFNTAEKVGAWLEMIDWAKQWPGSHLFWGGMHCFSFARACTPEWGAAVFEWLNANLDESTGWWRKGIAHADRHQPLGGSVHILPIYQHHGQTFPYPERVIDSVLALQLPNHRWLATGDMHIMHYLELDALYALSYMRQLARAYRAGEIVDVVERYGGAVIEYYRTSKQKLFEQHPHLVLAAVGTLGLLQGFMPDVFVDDVRWTDIFSDLRFYNTLAVEV